VLRCAVLRCAALHCAVLCCAVIHVLHCPAERRSTPPIYLRAPLTLKLQYNKILPADFAAACTALNCRDKEHSTIIFEGPADTPLLRLGWNKQDPRYIATLVADSPKVRGWQLSSVLFTCLSFASEPKHVCCCCCKKAHQPLTLLMCLRFSPVCDTLPHLWQAAQRSEAGSCCLYCSTICVSWSAFLSEAKHCMLQQAGTQLTCA
jgi:hypothetical protein